MTELSPITINDPIWGKSTIEELVLLELIESPEMQRLKGISQLGPPVGLHHLKGAFYRYEHSVGAMLAVRKVDGDLKQQAKALIHDVNHPAFSHLGADWVRGTQETDSHQDNTYEEFLRKSGIPDVLARHGFSVDEFVLDSNFPLVEQEIPGLCADRVDYTLRELLLCGFGTQKLIDICTSSLTTYEERMVFDDRYAANDFGWGFIRLWGGDWSNRKSLGQYLLMRNILQEAMGVGVISAEDFNQDDEFILDKLREDKDKSWTKRLDNLRLPLDENPDLQTIQGRHSPQKFRWVDPEFVTGSGVKKLTEENPIYRKAIKEEREAASKGFDI